MNKKELEKELENFVKKYPTILIYETKVANSENPDEIKTIERPLKKIACYSEVIMAAESALLFNEEIGKEIHDKMEVALEECRQMKGKKFVKLV